MAKFIDCSTDDFDRYSLSDELELDRAWQKNGGRDEVREDYYSPFDMFDDFLGFGYVKVKRITADNFVKAFLEKFPQCKKGYKGE